MDNVLISVRMKALCDFVTLCIGAHEMSSPLLPLLQE